MDAKLDPEIRSRMHDEEFRRKLTPFMLRLCHGIGMTNLTDKEVELAYLKLLGSVKVCRKKTRRYFKLPPAPQFSKLSDVLLLLAGALCVAMLFFGGYYL